MAQGNDAMEMAALEERLRNGFLMDPSSDGRFPRALKVRPVDGPDNSSSSASDCCNLFVGDEGKVTEQGHKPCERMKRRLVEVFSVQFLLPPPRKCRFSTEEIYGLALLKPSCHNFHATLFRRRVTDPQIVDQEGFLKLSGPMHGVDVKDELAIHAYLWTLLPPSYNDSYLGTLWRADMHETLLDRVICKEVETVYGSLIVTFAVYKDGVEALVEVELVDWEAPGGVEAFGAVTARNSCIVDSSAQSKLFESSSNEAIFVGRGKVAKSLPLSRSVTVLPRGSMLLVGISLWQRDILTSQARSIAGTLEFDARLTGKEEQVVRGDCGKVKVTVTWSK